MTTSLYAASLMAGSEVQKKYSDSGRAFVPQPGRNSLGMRKFQIASLLADGEVRYSEQIGPALPIFETAFSAFARGTQIKTAQGQVAIEDLIPGTQVQTADHGPSTVIWVGSMTLVPNTNNPNRPPARLTRVMADSYGLGRPDSDLMAGPAARILTRPTGIRNKLEDNRILTPASDLADGMNAIEITPPTPVTVYHIALKQHAIIFANGLEAETYHPGSGFERTIGEKTLTLFLSFFSHIKEPGDFGNLTTPRLPIISDDGVNLA